jgi:hypothetical protein
MTQFLLFMGIEFIARQLPTLECSTRHGRSLIRATFNRAAVNRAA